MANPPAKEEDVGASAVKNKPGTLSIRGQAIHIMHPPPQLAPPRPEEGFDGPPRRNTPPLPDYKPYNPSVLSSPAQPVRDPAGPPPEGFPSPAGRRMATWAPSGWDPVTGWRGQAPGGVGVPRHVDLAELPAADDRTTAEPEAAPPRPAGPTAGPTAPSTAGAGGDDDVDDRATRPMPMPLPSLAALAALEGAAATTTTTTTAVAELAALRDEIHHLLGRAAGAGAGHDGVLAWGAAAWRARGREEGLDEVRRALRARAAARHVGLAEARILRREADAVGEGGGGDGGEGGGGDGARPGARWRAEQLRRQQGQEEAALGAVARAVEGLYDRARALAVAAGGGRGC